MITHPLQLFEGDPVINYRAGIASLVRGLWSGTYSIGEFISSMELATGNGLTRAWNEGAAVMGIYPDEFTQEEINIRDSDILIQYQYIVTFAQYIELHSKANKGKLGALQYRVNMWANSYRSFMNKSKSIVGGNRKLKWVLGSTDEHCEDCAKLAGRVYRRATWEKWNIRPQSHDLACRGYNCKCNLEPTNDPANKGKPPRLSG